MAHEYSPVAGMHCTDPPGPYIEVAGAMSASREPCTVVRFIVWQRRLHASPPANELSWLLDSKHLATPAIGHLAKAVSRYISQGNAGLMFKHNFVSKSVALKDPKKGLELNDTQLLYKQLY